MKWLWNFVQWHVLPWKLDYYLSLGSKAHKELLLVIGSKRLLSDIRMLSPAEQTSMLEAQHKVVCQFAPKFVCFSYAAMKQRYELWSINIISTEELAQACCFCLS